MGAVYRAWDLRLKVPVALKEMRPQPGLDLETLEGLREQFEQEAAILARMNHPNLVRVTDYFEEGGNAYLVMNYVEGKSLADVIVERGAQPEAQVVDWAMQLLDALAYCHSQGVVHRDIKPQNIILKPDGKVILVDFGLVKLWNPHDPRTRTVMRGMGTPEYAPPEQYGVSDYHTGPASDLYSLGATLYHALTGQAPPTATDRMAVPERFAPLRRLAPSVSAQTESVVMKALALARPDRWSSAGEMTAALLRGATPPPPTLSPSQPSTRPPAPVYHPPTGGTAAAQAPPISRGIPPAVKQKPGRAQWLWIVGIAGGLLCIAAVCFGVFVVLPWMNGNGGTTPTKLTPEPTAALENTPAAVLANFQFTVKNRSSHQVCYVYISPTDSEEWGDDRLSSGETIPTGSTRTFDVSAGTYDVMIRDCDGVALNTDWDVSTDKTLEIGGPGLAALRITNNLDVAICFVYISPSNADSWGDDKLGAKEDIRANGGERIIFTAPDTYDFLAKDCDSNSVKEAYSIAVSGEATWTIEP